MARTLLTVLLLLLVTFTYAQKVEEQIVWKKGGRLPAVAGKANPGVAGAFVGVNNEVLIVAGGANFPDKLPWEGGKKAFLRNVFVFKKSGDSLQSIPVVTQLPQAVAYGSSVSTPEGLICAGGENERGALKSVFRLSWNSAKGALDLQSLPDLPQPLSNALLATSNGRLYLAGGESDGQTVSDFLTLDLNNLVAGWKKLPSLPVAVSHAVGGIQSNGDGDSFFIFGGRSRNADGPSTFYTEGFSYDIKKHNWEPRQPLPGAGLSAGTGLAVGSTYILVVSGDDGSTFRQVEEVSRQLAASPNSDALLAQRSRLLNGHPGFGRGVLFYNTITDRWTNLADFPGAGQVTTTAVRWGHEIYLPSGEVKAGVRTPEIWQGTLLQKTYFAWLDYGVLIIYFLLMIFIGWWTSRHQHSTDDFFRGGEKIPGWATGLSIFGAKLSAITFIGIPAKTYAKDWTYFFLLMTIVMVMPFVIKYFIPFYRRINATSAYEYLEKRFNYTTRFLGAVLYILLQLGRMGIVLLLPSIALSVVTGIDVVTGIVIMSVVSIFYTVLGGIEAVIWTEVVQVIILLGGAILTLGLIPLLLEGDWQSHYQTLKNYDKLTVFDFSFDWQSSTFWVVLIGGFSLNLIQYGADQTVVQRYLTTKDQKTAEDSLRLGAWLTVPSTIIFFAIGSLLYLYYQQQPGMVNIALDSQDTIYPWFIVNEMPVGIAGLVITAIFAAAMGALNGSVNCVATVFTNDLFRPFSPNLSEKTYLRTARWVTFTVGIFGMVVALLMAQWKAYSLWDQFNVILGLFTGSIGGVFMLGIFTTRANGPGVVAGLILSTVFQFWVSQYTSLNLLMYAFTGLVSSLLFGYLFSLVFSAPKKSLAGLTIHEV